MIKVSTGLVLGVLFLLAQSSSVFGQTASEGADPGRIEQRIDDIRKELPPREVAPLDLPTAPPPERPIEDVLSFVLSAVVFEGNTRFPASDFIPFYEDYLVRQIGRTEVEAIVSAVTEYYRSNGYLLSWAEVPAQSVRAGVLRVRVIEGYVSRTILSDPISDNAAIARFAAKIEAEQPLSRKTLERFLLLIEDLPGVTIERSTLSKADQPGAFALSLLGQEDRLEARAYMDNRGTSEVGRLQGLAVAGINDTLGLGEHLELNFFTVPNDPSELVYFGFRGSLPVGTFGTAIMLDASQSFLDPGGSLEDEDSKGETTRVRSGFKHPVLRNQEISVWAGSTVEVNNISEDRDGSPYIRDRLRVVRGSLEIRASDNWAGASLVALEASRGLDILDASHDGDANLSRQDGDPQFTKFTANVTRLQRIDGPVQLRATASGQVANDPLPSSEQFGLGGTQYGRAYDFFELSGDYGVAGSLELQWLLEETQFGHFQPYSFVDGGVVSQRNANNSSSLASVGAGVRWFPNDQFNFGLELAQPINLNLDSDGNRHPRVFFSVAAQF